jgi:predicted PurR-regulated permease PerM
MYNRTTIMKTLSSYALLLATWIVIVTIIVYLWVAKALEPPFWSFIILLATAVVPLAARVRIGNWFDFTRKVDQLAQDVNTNKKDIQQLGTQLTNISTQLQSVMLIKQAQQQIVANFPDPETAKAFAQSFAATPESLYPPSAAERATKEDKNFVYFLWAADEVISSAKFSLMTIYVLLEGESVTKDNRVHQPIKRLVQEIRQICENQGPFPRLRKELPQCLDALEGSPNL